MKKQILFFGLYLLLFSTFSFSMMHNVNNPPVNYTDIDQQRAWYVINGNNSVKKVVNIIKNIERYNAQNNSSSSLNSITHAYLLFGPSGSGKTTLADAVGPALNKRSLFISPAGITDFSPSSQKELIINKVGPCIERDEPCVVVVDDVDLLRPVNVWDVEGTKITYNAIEELRDYMREAKHRDQNRALSHFIFFLTTSNISGVSQRLSRLCKPIEIKNPEQARRVSLLSSMLANDAFNARACTRAFLENLSGKMGGFSVRDLERVVSSAVTSCNVTEADIQQGRRISIDQKRLEDAYQLIYPYTEAYRNSWWRLVGWR